MHRDLAGVEDNEDTSIPVLMIDTAGCDLQELDVPDELSKANEGGKTGPEQSLRPSSCYFRQSLRNQIDSQVKLTWRACTLKS